MGTFLLVGENAGTFTVLGNFPTEDAADNGASDYDEDARFGRLHIAEIITTLDAAISPRSEPWAFECA